MVAALEGRVDCVKELLDAGADVNHKNKDQDTALLLAAPKGHADIVKILLSAGAKINAGDKNDSSPLMIAANNEQKQM